MEYPEGFSRYSKSQVLLHVVPGAVATAYVPGDFHAMEGIPLPTERKALDRFPFESKTTVCESLLDDRGHVSLLPTRVVL